MATRKMSYQHTQIGYLIITVVIVLIGVTVLILFYRVANRWRIFSGLIIGIISLLLLLFSTLTVTIENDILKIWFGPGIFQKTFPLKEIDSYRIVKNQWYYGWGIRRLPDGWLYNVSGFNAIELEMKSGLKYRIGTDEPGELEDVIRQSLSKSYEAPQT